MFLGRLFAVTVLIMMCPGTMARYSKGAEGRIRDYLLNHANFSTRDRPVVNSSDSVHLGISLQFYSMLDVRERDQVITTALWITLIWRDVRLSWDPSDFDDVDLVVIYTDEIWIPRIFLTNALDSSSVGVVTSDRGSILLTSSGEVHLGAPLIQSTHCPLQIKYFPFDTQVCEFQFIPENQPSEMLIIYTLPSRASSTFETSEWKFSKISHIDATWIIENLVSNRPISPYSIATFCIYLNREPNYYISSLLVPSTMLCLMSFATFLAPPDSGERISLGVSMVLGLTVFQLLVADLLPATDEEDPLLSNYLAFNFILACLVIPFSLVNINIAYGDKTPWFLKYPCIKKLFIDIIPRLVGVPTYRSRIRTVTIDSKASPECALDCMNTAVHHLDPTSNMENGPVLEDTKSRESKQPCNKKQHKSPEEVKLEARTVALVMDRIWLMIFLAVFAVFCVNTSLKFQMNTGEFLNSTCGDGDYSTI